MRYILLSVRSKVYSIVLFFLFISSFSFSQPGTLDLSYGREGIVTTGIIEEHTRGIVIQSDGKIVVGGYNSVNGDNVNSEYGLSRYFQNGTVDTTFGYRGVVHTTFPGTFAKGMDMVLQPDGKIILAGQNYSEYAMARYLTDGTLDSTFGLNGLVSVDVGGHPDEVRSVLLQPDGKILVSGESRVNLKRDFSIARFESNGDFDLTFGNQGKVIVSISPVGQEYCEGMALQPDGKIVAAGTVDLGSGDEFAVVRYNNDGSLDTTFGNSGIKIVAITNNRDYCTSVAIQSDGKIVLGGYTEYMVDSFETTLVRVLPDGSIDSLYGTAGISHPINTTYDYISKIITAPDDKLLVVKNNIIFRCLNNGSIDSTFGNSGLVTHSYYEFLLNLKLYPDSSIAVVGYHNGSWNNSVFVSKMEPNGTILFSLVHDYGYPFDLFGYDITVLDNDKTVVLGNFTQSFGPEGVALARYDSIGHLDLTFGVEGIARTNTSAIMYSFKRQSDGKFIAGGRTSTTNFGIMRFDSTGFSDPTFGVNGSVQTSFPTSFVPQGIRSVDLQSDGKIVVTGFGSGSGPGTGGIATVRYLPNGTLDPTFSGDGISIENFSGTHSEGYDVKVQYDGKIIVAGSFLTSTNYALGILRLNSDGTIDNTFGVNGKIEITHPDGIQANDLLILPDHKILVTGSTLLFNDNAIVLLKYNENGTADATFGTLGTVITNLTSYNDNGAVILGQSDGKILIGANTLIGIRVIRYNAGGSVDPTFGNVGVGSINVSIPSSCNSIAFQSDGKIMVGGGGDHSVHYYMLLARFDSSGVLSSINEMPPAQSNNNQLVPNPSNGDFNFLNAESATINIEVYATDGKLVFKKLQHPSSQTLITNLPSGLYQVKVVDGKHQGIHRVVVVRP